MKKYKLKNDDLYYFIGNLPNGGKTLIGNFDTGGSEVLADYVMALIKGGHIKSVREAVIYAHDNRGLIFYEEVLQLARKGEAWPIELGLVEEVVERVYMDRYEALRMVYEHGKKVAYDSEEWLFGTEYVYLDESGTPSRTKKPEVGCVTSPMNKKYNQKRWYVVEDK